MKRLTQRPTQTSPRFQFSLTDIFVATAFSAVGVLTAIWFFRLPQEAPVYLVRVLAIASSTSAGGAVGALLRNTLVGVMIGACVGAAVFSHLGGPPSPHGGAFISPLTAPLLTLPQPYPSDSGAADVGHRPDILDG